MDPQLVQLRTEVRSLQKNIQRISSLTAGPAPALEPKERREVTQAEREAAEKETAEEGPARRRTKST